MIGRNDRNSTQADEKPSKTTETAAQNTPPFARGNYLPQKTLQPEAGHGIRMQIKSTVSDWELLRLMILLF
ncbi:hypothetical protein ACX8XN_09715 [Calditrichota bacterium GD2]